MNKIACILIMCLLSACAGQTTQPADVEDRSVDTDGAQGADSSALDSESAGFHPLNDPDSILSQRSVYYDFDSYIVKSEYRPLVISHAQYLRDNPNAQVILQGNTDDRGSREYNLALGQRRADGVKNIMTLSGARASQIESVSLGEEKPRTYGNDEAAWRENRRTDIIYRGE